MYTLEISFAASFSTFYDSTECINAKYVGSFAYLDFFPAKMGTLCIAGFDANEKSKKDLCM